MMSEHSPENADASDRFRDLAWPMLPVLLRTARWLTRNEHQAEDLVQETMLRAYRHMHTYRSGTNIKAWLMTILRRTHIDLYRQTSRSVATDSLDAMHHEPAGAQQSRVDAHDAWREPKALLERFDDQAIEQALVQLPEAMRWTLLLLDVEQLSVQEAAEALDVAPGTIKSRASRARAMLRETLHDHAKKRGWITDQPTD